MTSGEEARSWPRLVQHPSIDYTSIEHSVKPETDQGSGQSDDSQLPRTVLVFRLAEFNGCSLGSELLHAGEVGVASQGYERRRAWQK